MRKMPSRAPVFLFRNVAPGGGRRLLGLNAFRIALICWRNQEFAIPLPPLAESNTTLTGRSLLN